MSGRLVAYALAMLSLLLSSSFAGSSGVRFCEVGQRPTSKDTVIFDRAHQLVLGRDASARLVVVENSVAIGVLAPFPIMLPKVKMSSGEQRWKVNEYDFKATVLSPSDPDWLLVQAQSTAGEGRHEHSTLVLYSQLIGVIAVRTLSYYEGVKVEQEFYSCGDERLRQGWFLFDKKPLTR